MRQNPLLPLLCIAGIIAFPSCHKDPAPLPSGIVSQKLMGGSEEEWIGTMIPTADGGFLVTGTTTSDNSGDVRSTHGSSDWWVVRLNSKHDTVWTRTLGGNGQEEVAAAATTGDGGFVLAGYTNSHNSGDVGANHTIGNFDCWVVKLTANGDIAWTRVLGGSHSDYAYAVTVTTDGSIVVAGKTNSNDGDVSGLHGGAGGSEDYWVMKLNGNGNLIWQKALGGSGIESANAITASADGGVVVAGTTGWSNDGDVGTVIGMFDAWIVKLDPDGNIAWKKVLGGQGTERINDICATADGGYIIAGSTNSDNSGNVGHNNGMEDTWLVKLKSNGDVSWTNTLGGSEDDGALSVAATPDGGCVFTGYTESNNSGDVGISKGGDDGWLVRLDANGQKQWTKNLGGNDDEEIGAICINPDGSYSMGATTYSSNSGDVSGANHGNTTGDAWIIKFRE